MADKNPIRFIPGCNTSPEVIRDQFRQNIDRGLPMLKMYECEERSEIEIAIVCGGPSLNDRWEELKDFDGHILACNGSYRFLIDRGISPSYFMLLDCRKDNLSFLDKLDKTTIHYIAAQAHPDIFDRLSSLDALTVMYLTNLPDINDLLGDRVGQKNCVLGGTVGTVGIKGMALAHAIGYRKMRLYGYDSSYRDDEHHAYAQPLNDNTKTMDVYVEDRKYVTSATLANQAEQFPAWAKNLVQFGGCDIELRCDGLLPDFMNFCNRLGAEKPLEDREREKYESVWKNDAYRKHSPGENLVDFAFDKMGMVPGDWLCDFGCGTGRAAKKFKDAYGIFAYGIDHADNCLDDHSVPFFKANLWQGSLRVFYDSIFLGNSFDWGYCTDVMEHIPPEKVMDVVKNIAKIVKKGCFFNIATRDDAMGSLIGRKLHMTVANADAWKAILKTQFKIIDMIDDDKKGEAIFCCFHK